MQGYIRCALGMVGSVVDEGMVDEGCGAEEHCGEHVSTDSSAESEETHEHTNTGHASGYDDNVVPIVPY